MPLKLIGFILFILVVFTFIGFNLDNKTDIDLWFGESASYDEVSVIIVVFCAYLFGLLSTVPFWFSRSLKRKRSRSKDAPSVSNPPLSEGAANSKKKRRPLLPKKKATLEETNS